MGRMQVAAIIKKELLMLSYFCLGSQANTSSAKTSSSILEIKSKLSQCIDALKHKLHIEVNNNGNDLDMVYLVSFFKHVLFIKKKTDKDVSFIDNEILINESFSLLRQYLLSLATS